MSLFASIAAIVPLLLTSDRKVPADFGTRKLYPKYLISFGTLLSDNFMLILF